MANVAIIERNGIPLDAPLVERLNRHWPGIRRHLIDAVDANFGVYENGHLRQARLKAYLVKHNIPWPLTERGCWRWMRHLPRASRPPPADRAALGAAPHAARPEAQQADGGPRRPQPHDAVGLPLAHRPQSAEQREVRVRACQVDPRADQAGARARHQLLRLVRPGDRDRRAPCRATVRCRRSTTAATPTSASRSWPTWHRLARRRTVTQVPATSAKPCSWACSTACRRRASPPSRGSSVEHARRLLRLLQVLFPTFWAWAEDNINRVLLGEPIRTVFGWRICYPPGWSRRLRQAPPRRTATRPAMDEDVDRYDDEVAVNIARSSTGRCSPTAPR